VDLNGKDPLIGRSVAWARGQSGPEGSGEHRTVERHRIRRRTRVKSEMRAKIRRRVVLACVGALLFMVAGIYFVLGHEGAGSGSRMSSGGSSALALR
jgi:hypothetical protein